MQHRNGETQGTNLNGSVLAGDRDVTDSSLSGVDRDANDLLILEAQRAEKDSPEVIERGNWRMEGNQKYLTITDPGEVEAIDGMLLTVASPQSTDSASTAR